MSLMCHEVRTPLNGCLASAEMLLETVLQASLSVPLHRNRAGIALCHRPPFATGLPMFGTYGGRIAIQAEEGRRRLKRRHRLTLTPRNLI